MGEEEISNTMNQDLNLCPDPELVLEPATNNSVAGLTDRANRRCDIELSQCMLRSAQGSALPASEGTIAVGERVSKDSKECENVNKVMEEEEKRVTDGSFFDCCICLELSKDPVVTNCGHLYCWSCLYQWLEVSYAKECPVCKGEVSVETLIPIYGHGGNREVSDTKIPSRPQAGRKESSRNSLNRSTEMNRHLRRLEIDSSIEERRARILQGRLERESNTRDRYLQRRRLELDSSIEERRARILQGRLERESSTGGRRARPVFERVMTLSELRAEQNQPSAALVAPVDNIDRFSDIVTEQEGENRNLRVSRALSIRRETQTERPVSMLPVSNALSNTESLANVMSERNTAQNNNPPSLVEDTRLGVIRSEIESMSTVLTSSFARRRENGLRVSDVDSAESLPLSRRVVLMRRLALRRRLA